MVWIHGGGFILGSGDRDFFGPDFLVDEQVVVVTFNYRLGVLGKYTHLITFQSVTNPGCYWTFFSC
jgi:carboxylesterase type B